MARGQCVVSDGCFGVVGLETGACQGDMGRGKSVLGARLGTRRSALDFATSSTSLHFYSYAPNRQAYALIHDDTRAEVLLV